MPRPCVTLTAFLALAHLITLTMKIQHKCLGPIYGFPEMKLLFPKQNYNVLSPSSYTQISVRDLYISRIGLPILLQMNMWADPGNIENSLTDT